MIDPADLTESEPPTTGQSPATIEPDSSTTSRSLETHTQHIAFAWSGPLPDPEALRRYQDLYPKAPEILFDRFEQQSKHRIRIEREELESTQLARKRGQWMAWTLGMGCIVIALALALKDKEAWSAGVALGSITILAATFITSRVTQRDTEVSSCTSDEQGQSE